ncbi:MAG: Gfo/Idh/MocA family oxidoreductase [Chitinophagales bacterium]
MHTIETGLIGFGTGGRIFHAPVVSSLQNFRLQKISTSNATAATTIRSQYPDTKIVQHPDEVLADPAIELVIIASPNTSHFSLAKKALLNGKHVIVEKPFTASVAEADELIALAESQKKIITVHHNRRWDSDFKTVKKIIDNKLLGTLVEYEAHFDRFRNVLKENSWKERDEEGSGILFDLGSHLIDQALCLFGAPDEVFSNLQKQRPGSGVTDQFELLLFYPGLKVTLKAGMLVREPLPHFILSGTNGSFVKFGMDVQEEALKKGLTPLNISNWGEEPEAIWGKINTDINGVHQEGKIASERGDYREFFQNVYDAIRSNKGLIVTPQQARSTIKVIELAMKSNEQKRTLKFE